MSFVLAKIPHVRLAREWEKACVLYRRHVERYVQVIWMHLIPNECRISHFVHGKDPHVFTMLLFHVAYFTRQGQLM